MTTRHLARICWNSRNWTEPTGDAARLGHGSYAETNGFGHEEWLFRPEWIVDECHYGFLEGVRRSHKRLAGTSIDVLLWTRDEHGRRWYVGRIVECDVLTDAEAANALRIYAENGWLDTMKEEIARCGGNRRALDSAPPSQILNIRYRPSDFESKRWPVPPGDRVLDFRSNWIAEVKPNEAATIGRRPPTGTTTRRPEKPAQRRAIDSTIMDFLHNRIQNRLYDLLVDRHGERNVAMEDGGVDIRVGVDGGSILIEVKSTTSPRLAIREGVGQLLEYAMYPPPASEQVLRLIVAAPGRPDADDAAYLASLTTRFSLNIEYFQATPDLTALPF